MTTINTGKDATAQARARMEKAVDDFRHDLAGLRTGRASVALLDSIRVDYHGTPMPLNQVANRFLIETLEPTATDSYFAWNFFDAILGQKEGYSGYAFEDIAAEYLKNNPDLKNKLEQRRATDTAFAKNANAQLNFVYQNSPYFESAYLKYPVFRVVN